MQVSNLINPNRIACNVVAGSKKKALEAVSELLAKQDDTLSSHDVFDCLLARERLGATGVGHGIAIPHGRLKHSEAAIAAMVRLAEGVDFGAADNKPVDILFALLVPEESTEEHLQILSQLAQMFSDAEFRQKVREADDSEMIFDTLEAWSKTTN